MSLVMEKGALDSLIRLLREKGYEVYGPIHKGPEFVFAKAMKAGDLALDYVTTILSPKKYLYAPSEKLFSFNAENFGIKEPSD
nr:hypothetical protein [Candidatus Njordarchaeota archaeon]